MPAGRIEVNPTSNVRLSVYPILGDQPFRRLHEEVTGWQAACGAFQLVEVTGPWLIDVSLMGADRRLALHLVNLSAPGSFNSGVRRPMEEITPIADLEIRVRIPDGTRCRGARLIVAGEPVATTHQDPSWVGLTVKRLNEFESVLLELA